MSFLQRLNPFSGMPEEKKRQEETRARRAEMLESQRRAEAWFRSLSDVERAAVSSVCPRVSGLLIRSPRRNTYLYATLSGLLALSFALFASEGAFRNLLGGLTLACAWLLFKAFERRLTAGLEFLDPLSGSTLVSLYLAADEPDSDLTA